MTVTPELLKKIPVFNDLHEVELTQIMGCFSCVSVPAGETLYSEGESATSACFLIDGELEALKALPGGGDALVGVIGPGNMIGEMALMAGGFRTAKVRAKVDSTILAVSYSFFRASLDQMSVPAFKILRRVIRSLTARLNELEKRIIAQWDCGTYSPRPTGREPRTPPLDQVSSGSYSFDYRPFLPIIPFFEDFDENEIDRVLERTTVLEVPRGDFLYREAEQARSCYVVVRGAIENSILRDRRYQLSVLGPGRLCGANDLIEERPHSWDARVRAGALLLTFDRAGFESLFRGESTECLKFQNVIGNNQLMELKAADNLLTMLVSQAHIQNG
jgi:CRP-like cAMP-binding protein